jgi:hypothetical protein
VSGLKKRFLLHPLRWSLILSCGLFILIAGQFWLVTPILETPDALGHYYYARILARSGQFPTLPSTDSLYSAAEEAGQFPLYYLLGAGLLQLFPDGDLDQVLIPDPHNLAGAGLTHNYSFHRPFTGFPTGAELAARVLGLFSIACGATTVACCVLLARACRPERQRFWLGAGATAAVLPAFASLSSGVSNDNLVTALSSITIVLLALWLVDGRARWSWLSVVALWLAVLAKFNAIGLVAGWLLTSLWRRRDVTWSKELAKLFGVGALLDGWWFVRNALLYGDPTAMLAINRQMQGAGYAPFKVTAGQALQRLGAELPKAYQTFFAEFGHYNIDAPWLFALVASLGSLGLALGVVSALRCWRQPLNQLILAFPTVILIEVAAYVLLSNADGRFLYPALAPLAVLSAGGLSWGLSRLPWTGAGYALTCGCGLAAIGCAWFVVKPGYAYPRMPAVLPAAAPPLQAGFADAVQLVGVETSPGQVVLPGQPVAVTLYWRRNSLLDLPLSEFVHIESSDPAYSAGAAYEGAPGGNFPPNFWPEGRLIEDRHQLRLNPDTRADRRNAVLLVVRAGMYYVSSHAGAPVQPVPADPPSVAETGVEIARWKIPGRPPPDTPAQPLAEFQNGLTLLSGRVSSSSPTQVSVDLRWLARSAPHSDDTVFVQAVSALGNVLGQHDSYPLEGRYATSAWSAGEQVFDRVPLSLSRPLEPSDRLMVGMYTLPHPASRIPTSDGQEAVTIPR